MLLRPAALAILIPILVACSSGGLTSGSPAPTTADSPAYDPDLGREKPCDAASELERQNAELMAGIKAGGDNPAIALQSYAADLTGIANNEGSLPLPGATRAGELIRNLASETTDLAIVFLGAQGAGFSQQYVAAQISKWSVASKALSNYCHGGTPAPAPSASTTSSGANANGMRSLISEGRTLPMTSALRAVAWREVATLQALLTDLGFGNLEPDGHFGPATEAAVRAFQRAYALKPDGVVGRDTLQTLVNIGNDDEAPTTAHAASPAPQYGGTLCADGWLSSSSGSGTCSWHGGIR